MSQLCATRDTIRVLIIGGQSRAARKLRQVLCGLPAFEVNTLVRRPERALAGETVYMVTDYFQPPPAALNGTSVAINFVGITDEGDKELFAVNAEGPRRLADAARRNGVRQIVHVSSLSVYGSATDIDDRTPEAPSSAYGQSKKKGDEALLAAAGADLLISILRVPILYGLRAGAKLHQLATAMTGLGWWPATRIDQPRSVLHLQNLASVIVEIVFTGRGGILFAADPQPFTLSLLRDVGESCTRRSIRLVRLPDMAFAPLRIAAAATYASLYARSYIEPTLCVEGGALSLRATREGLKDLFAASGSDR